MARIQIDELRPVGYDLLSDSESFMTDLTENELNVEGGALPIILTIASAKWVGSAVIASVAGAASYIKARYF